MKKILFGIFCVCVSTNVFAENMNEMEMRCRRYETVLLPKIIEIPNTVDDFEKNIRIYNVLRQECPYPYGQEYDARWRAEIELSDFIQELNK